MTRTVLGGARLLGIALAVAAGCGGSLSGTGGHGGNGAGGAVGAGGVGALALTGTGGAGGTSGDGGIGSLGGSGVISKCTICARSPEMASGCPAGAALGLGCSIGVQAELVNGFCCAAGQDLQCLAGPGNVHTWMTTCGGPGGTGAGGIGGVGGDVGGTIGAGGVATGSGGVGGNGGGSGGATGTGGQGGVACGGKSCAAGQLCVHPSCAGGIAASGCMPLPDGGTCPQGSTRTDFCSPTGPACIQLPCDSPPPFCTNVPAACLGNPTCACLASDICTINGGSGGCEIVTPTDVTCGAV